jgi:hypothetical protein
MKLTHFLDILYLFNICSGEETSANPWIQLIHKMLISEDRNVDEMENVLEDIFQHNSFTPVVSNHYTEC